MMQVNAIYYDYTVYVVIILITYISRHTVMDVQSWHSIVYTVHSVVVSVFLPR
jgi:hypothetical protein